MHLKVADLECALKFYCGVLGFELQQRFGSSAVFISAGGYHHHIGLNTWGSAGGSPPPPRSTGRYHLAFFIQRARRWRMRCGACSRRAANWTARRIMA